MAALDTTACLVGPIPFNDVEGEDNGGSMSSIIEEYADMVSGLLPFTAGPGMELRQYRGV